VAVDMAGLIEWLPNSSSYDADDPVLLRSLIATVVDVAGNCRRDAVEYDDTAPVVVTDGVVTTPPTALWPEPVQLATLMLAADNYASHNRPGVLEFGTYMPRNRVAATLLGRYLRVF
jgi:hypothetical protein